MSEKVGVNGEKKKTIGVRLKVKKEKKKKGQRKMVPGSSRPYNIWKKRKFAVGGGGNRRLRLICHRKTGHLGKRGKLPAVTWNQKGVGGD